MPRCGYPSRCRGTSRSSAIDETNRFQTFFRLGGPGPQHRGTPRTRGSHKKLAPSNTYTWVAVTTRSETASRSCGRCRPGPETFFRAPGPGRAAQRHATDTGSTQGASWPKITDSRYGFPMVSFDEERRVRRQSTKPTVFKLVFALGALARSPGARHGHGVHTGSWPLQIPTRG